MSDARYVPLYLSGSLEKGQDTTFAMDRTISSVFENERERKKCPKEENKTETRGGTPLLLSREEMSEVSLSVATETLMCMYTPSAHTLEQTWPLQQTGRKKKEKDEPSQILLSTKYAARVRLIKRLFPLLQRTRFLNTTLSQRKRLRSEEEKKEEEKPLDFVHAPTKYTYTHT